MNPRARRFVPRADRDAVWTALHELWLLALIAAAIIVGFVLTCGPCV